MMARNLLLELPFQTIREFWKEYLVCPKLSLFSFEDAEAWFKTVVGEIFSLAEPQFAYAGVALHLNPGFSAGRSLYGS